MQYGVAPHAVLERTGRFMWRVTVSWTPAAGWLALEGVPSLVIGRRWAENKGRRMVRATIRRHQWTSQRLEIRP